MSIQLPLGSWTFTSIGSIESFFVILTQPIVSFETDERT